jgi:hypothetical protein
MGQASDTDCPGLANSTRQACTVALRGFHSAMCRSQGLHLFDKLGVVIVVLVIDGGEEEGNLARLSTPGHGPQGILDQPARLALGCPNRHHPALTCPLA